MATIQIKRSVTAGAVPSSLADGELALQRADRTIFFKDSGNAIRDLLDIDCGEIVPVSGMSLWAAEALNSNWHWSN